MGLNIVGTGSYLPDYVVTNKDFEAFLDTSDEWIRTRTGMVERRISLETPTWKMGELAARKALEAAGTTPEELDLILCTTVTGDFLFPSTACMIQGALGAHNAFAYDIAAACTGAVYALDQARLYLASGEVKTILLVSAETLTQATDYTDRGSCILFGDGAGAAVVKAGDGLFGASLHSDPSGACHLYAKKPRQELPFARKPVPFEEELFPILKEGGTVMNGREVYKFATRAMPKAVRGACAKVGITVDDLDLLLPHQANLRIIETAVKALGIAEEKVYNNIHKYGNTSSATVMTCLDECVRQGRLRRGDKLCLVGFGAGLTYGAAVLEY